MNVYSVNDNKSTLLEPTTFSELGMSEHNLEEIIKENGNIISDDESILIIGQQVRNTSNGRCDLVALNQNGDLVLVEIKRDRKDIEGRREAFEFQAIRYAAAFATIKDFDDLISKIYAPFLETKQIDKNQSLTITEIANRNLEEFFEENELTIEDFNQRQQIILVASDFDDQTLSAVAWLNSNGVEISCIKLIPYKINDSIYIQSERVLPLPQYEDYYVDILDKGTKVKSKRSNKLSRRNLPKIDSMIKWGVVKAGDLLQAKNHQAKATLLANGNVKVNNEEKSIQQWLKEVYSWSSVATYTFTIHVETGKSLSELRKEYMERNQL